LLASTCPTEEDLGRHVRWRAALRAEHLARVDGGARQAEVRDDHGRDVVGPRQ